MSLSKRIALLVSLLVSVVLMSAVVAGAKPPAGQPDHPQKPSDRSDKPAAPNTPPKSKRCKKVPKVAFVAKGTFTSFVASADTTDDPSVGDLTVNVTRTNRPARAYLGTQTFSTVGAVVSLRGVTDANADSVVALDDAAANDRVVLIGKLNRPKKRCPGAATLTLRRINVNRPPTQ